MSVVRPAAGRRFRPPSGFDCGTVTSDESHLGLLPTGEVFPACSFAFSVIRWPLFSSGRYGHGGGWSAGLPEVVVGGIRRGGPPCFLRNRFLQLVTFSFFF